MYKRNVQRLGGSAFGFGVGGNVNVKRKKKKKMPDWKKLRIKRRRSELAKAGNRVVKKQPS
jgi:hypothetical protein